MELKAGKNTTFRWTLKLDIVIVMYCDIAVNVIW